MVKTLKSVLDIAAPLGYAPTDGNERRMRFSAGVTPEMIFKRLGETVSKAWHFDPIYRYNTNLAIKKKLNALCPDIESFRLHYDNGVESFCNSLSGVYGIGFIPSLYGLDIIYDDLNWTEVKAKNFDITDFDGIFDVEVENSPLFCDLMKQMDEMEREFGKITGHLNMQGVLNVAFKLRREEIFYDMVDYPEICEQLFSSIASAIIKSQKLLQARQRKSGYDVNMLVPADCMLNMISPEMYREQLFSFDKLMVDSFKNNGIHTCNWNVTRYLDVLSGIDDLGYLDMGGVSDTKAVQQAFPNARKSVLLSPVLLHRDFSELAALIDRISDDMTPVDFTMGSIDSSCPIDVLNKLNDYIVNHRTNR